MPLDGILGDPAQKAALDDRLGVGAVKHSWQSASVPPVFLTATATARGSHQAQRHTTQSTTLAG